MTTERVTVVQDHHEFRDDGMREREGYLTEVGELAQTVEAREYLPRSPTRHEVEQTMHMGMFGV